MGDSEEIDLICRLLTADQLKIESCQNYPAKIIVYFLTTQKSLMLVFYIFGFYMILLILTVIVLLMLYCFDFMP